MNSLTRQAPYAKLTPPSQKILEDEIMIFKKVVIDGKEYYQREDSEEKRKKEEAQVCSEVKEEFIEGVIADSGTSNSDESFSKDAQEFF